MATTETINRKKCIQIKKSITSAAFTLLIRLMLKFFFRRSRLTEQSEDTQLVKDPEMFTDIQAQETEKPR